MITVVNTGANDSNIIFGGQGAADLTDGDDAITVDRSGGTITLFGNAGNEAISALGLQDSTNATLFGGRGGDTITLGHASVRGRSNLVIYGGEDGDWITASGNSGSLTLYGGTGQANAADGGDTITLAGTNTGTIMVMANGGADIVQVGATGTEAATRITVFCGDGNDSIQVAAQTNGTQALNLTGNDGADVLRIAKGAEQTIVITDLSLDGGDQLFVTGLGLAAPRLATGAFLTLTQALDAASDNAGAGKAAVVTFGGSSYVVLKSTGDQAFNRDVDQVITLTGVTDTGRLLSHLSMA